jgi:hypothetical protein
MLVSVNGATPPAQYVVPVDTVVGVLVVLPPTFDVMTLAEFNAAAVPDDDDADEADALLDAAVFVVVAFAAGAAAVALFVAVAVAAGAGVATGVVVWELEALDVVAVELGVELVVVV